MNREDLPAELERLRGASFAWALSRCRRDREEAADVLQTSYLKILDGRAGFRGAAPFKTFLFGVIRLTAAESRRREWVRRLRLAEWRPPATEAPAASDLDREVFRLRLALARLARRQREVLELVFGHDLSVEESAVALGISVGSARVHYDRAKKRLRKELGEMTR